ncbi:MAG: DUF2239 family protein [Bacteroidetes bacterium]|nr:DUF2239 family protein [Bacteroidota bacterium]
MYTQIAETCIAFDGNRLIADGDILDVVQKVKAHVDRKPDASVLMFDGVTSYIVELDLRGDIDDVMRSVEARLKHAGLQTDEVSEEHRGPGRPKLGVVSREVTLLPRHWEWLEQQPGSASVTLRKLVEEARKRNLDKDRIRQAQESCYRFMNAMAGDQQGFEEALRALYAGDPVRFGEQIASWPAGIRKHTEKLANAVFAS